MTQAAFLLWASLLVSLAVPLAWGVANRMRSRAHDADRDARRNPPPWRAMLGSTLLYVLAFNLTFFVQEVFLVVPKAFTPGLQPTLFHNNHRWDGEHPLAALFQGTGALATALMGLACLWAVRRGAGRTPARRMLLVWLAFAGLLMALPQVVIGAISSGSDVGMAMAYLDLPVAGRSLAACLALPAIPLVALALRRPVLEIVVGDAVAMTSAVQARHVLWLVTVPALLAMVLIVPYRVPREWLEVALLPVLVTLPGIAWMQAGARRDVGATPRVQGRWPLAWLVLAALALLAFFQGVLRPGVPFHWN